MRGENVATYRYHIHGKLCGQTIDKKYTSLNQFLNEYGGDKTCLNINRSKLSRLRKAWNGNEKIIPPRYITNEYKTIKSNWFLHIDLISEARKKKVVKHVLYFD